MGDRTYVQLTFPKEHYDVVKPFAEDACTEDYYAHTPNLYCFCFSEVNTGDLDFLRELRNLGIAYNSSWDRGDNYKEGVEYCRFTPEGKRVIKTIYDGDENPRINELLIRIDSYEELKQYILDHAERHSILPWDNQVEYGKIYRAMRLITPED